MADSHDSDIASAAAADQHVKQSMLYARPLDSERCAADSDDAALELAADQGIALRFTIAHAASAAMYGLLEVAGAVYDVANAIRERPDGAS